MADVTPILIKDLKAQTTLQDTDYFIVGGEDAKKITVGQMKEALGINELNTKFESYKRLYKDTTVKQNAWATLVIPHGLGKVPTFILATPYCKSNGRIYWITRANETNITISIYSADPGEYGVGFYVLCS